MIYAVEKRNKCAHQPPIITTNSSFSCKLEICLDTIQPNIITIRWHIFHHCRDIARGSAHRNDLAIIIEIAHSKFGHFASLCSLWPADFNETRCHSISVILLQISQVHLIWLQAWRLADRRCKRHFLCKHSWKYVCILFECNRKTPGNGSGRRQKHRKFLHSKQSDLIYASSYWL